MAQNNPGQQLSDLLVTRGYDPEMLDSAGKAAPTAQDAEIFSFDFVEEIHDIESLRADNVLGFRQLDLTHC